MDGNGIGSIFSRLLHGVTTRILTPKVLSPDRRLYAEPSELGLPAHAIEVRRRDGVVLRGYRIDPPGGGPAPVVVLLPGIAGNLSAHVLYLELIHRAGCAAVAFDYAGYGRSEGAVDLRNYRDDSLAACAAARSLAAERYGGGPIGIFGVSIGANLALAAAVGGAGVGAVAAEGLSIQRELLRGIILDGAAGPRSVAEMSLDGESLPVRDRIHFKGIRARPPVASVISWIGELIYPFAGKNPLRLRKRLRSLPLLLIHGTADRVLPLEASLVLRRALGGRAELWLIPGIGHAQEPALAIDEEYAAQLGGFFRRRLEGGGAAVDEAGPILRIERSAAGGSAVSVALPEEAQAGAFLVAIAGRRVLQLHRPWLEPGGRFEADHPEPDSQAAALRMHHAERRGARWEPVHSPRARLFAERYGGGLQAAWSALHSGDIGAAGRELEAFAALDPPRPFDIIARLHAGRLDDMAAEQDPALARRARELFVRFGALPAEAASP